MNFFSRPANTLDACVSVSDAPEGLSAIHNPDCAAAVWSRRPMQSFQSWIDALQPEQLPRTRVVLRPHAVRRALTDLFDASTLASSAERDILIDDIAAMADMFADVMKTPYLRLRLDVINTNACRKFHIDAVTARLVCTYRGTGTQYGISADGEDPEQIITVGTASPIVLRGTLWPAKPNPALKHRSPPIEGTGETRLVLVLDPVKEFVDEAERQYIH